MATRYAIAILLLCASTSALAWSEADTKRELAYLTLHTIDWSQTLDIAESDEFFERNQVLGSHPDRGEVHRYFVLTGLTHYGISRALPPNYRKWWQRITIATRAGYVAHNISIGVEFRF